MAYSHCTLMGLGMRLRAGQGSTGSNILYSNVRTSPRQGLGPGPIASYCASPGPVSVQCEQAVRFFFNFGLQSS